MPGVSLNTVCTNPNWRSEQENLDDLFARHESYFLPGKAIKPDVACQSTVCKWETRSAAGKSSAETSGVLPGVSQTIPKYQPMALCFSCNRCYHLICIDITLREDDPYGKSWFSESLPWLCPECQFKPLNIYAEQYYESNKWKEGIESRRKQVLSAFALNSDPKLARALKPKAEYYQDDLLIFTELETTAYFSTYQPDQQKEIEKVINSMADIVIERDNLLTKMSDFKKLQQQYEELKKAHDHSLLQLSFKAPSSTFCEPSIKSSKDILSMIYLKAKIKKDSSSGFDSFFANTSHPIKSFNQTKSADQSGAGLPQPEKSCLGDIDLSKLDVSQKITLEQANAQRESSAAQREMSTAILIEQQRKSLQKITTFNGDERDWIRFKRDIQRYREVGRYDDDILKLYVMKALEGVAADRVRDMIDHLPLAYTLKVLEDTFGDPTRIINKRGEDILALKLGKELYKDDAVNVLTKIQAYFAACKYAGVEVANTNHLAKHIFDQFNCEQRQRCRRLHREENMDDSYTLIDLETIFKFLEMLMKDLDDRKPKSTQVNSTSFTPQSSSQSNDQRKNDHYVIRDLSEAKYMGYDTKQLESSDKKCLSCGGNHYTVECKKYYALDKENRNKLVQDKGLCRNCVVSTSHVAKDCKLKPSCGLMSNNVRCNGKHHVSLHSVNRRNNFHRGRRGAFSKKNNNEENLHSQPTQTQHSNSNTSNTSQTNSHTIPSTSKERLQADIRKNALSTAMIHVNSLSNYNTNSEQGNTVKVFKTKFFSNDGKFIIGHSVGDSASETTLLSEDLRRALKLEGEKCKINVRWADSTIKSIDALKVTLVISGVQRNAENLILEDCYAVGSDDFALPPRSLDIKLLKRKFPYLKQVKCDSYYNVIPKLLIGSHHASVIESCSQLLEGGPGKPVGLLAKLGWSVYGGNPETIQSSTISNVQFQVDHTQETALSNDELFEALSYFNSIENLSLNDGKLEHNIDEQKAIDIMEEETRILSDGSIEVPLVWNRDGKIIPRLFDNFPMVMKRQLAHEARLLKNPEHHRIYNEKFKELLVEGYVRKANAEDLNYNWQNVNYLPMTLVVNQNKVPVGYRIVFDAAAKYKGDSLNMNLLKGPDLLINLYEPVIGCRTKKVALTADIKAMFMQMRMCLRDAQCQRVLFRESPDQNMEIFIVTRVLFGPNCSPFQSQYCKNLVAGAWQDLYPEAANAIIHSMYMDDLITSESSTEKAIQLAINCIDIFASVQWKLIQFQSNDINFLKGLPFGTVKQEIIPLMEDKDQLCVAKVLGCVWDTKNDVFTFNFDKNLYIKIIKDCQQKPTKRIQCSTIARIFDIMGFLSHLVIRGRILLQRSWANGVNWDQTISDEDHKLWLEWLSDLENVANIKIPRKLCLADDLWNTGEVALHVFCDAGAEAYAAVAYLVTEHNGSKMSRIVMARAKVTPLRFKTKMTVTEIPRLELYAALCASRITHMITNSLKNLNLKRYLWTDSEVVLRWIQNSNMALKAYAKSPIEEILTKTNKIEWLHVPTKLNVADIATKFKRFDFADSNSIWFSGPKFILQDKTQWPPIIDLSSKREDDKKQIVTSLCHVTLEKADVIEFISPIKLPPVDDPIANELYISTLSPSIRSTWIKLVRATARGLKIYLDGFIPLIKSKRYNDPKEIAKIREINFNILTPHDLDRAELFLIRRAQRQIFAEDYDSLNSGVAIKNKEMQQLLLFVDDQGVIRIRSRVKLGSNVYPQQFAPFLRKENPYTRLFLLHVHYEYQHIHLETQVAASRSKYWIPSVRVALKSIQQNCNFCRYMRARAYAPMMAPLPNCRINPMQYPFQTAGLDCAGPITVKIYNKDKKVWILIFSCTLTRFIQLHLLESLESIRVMEAIATLWSTNGPVQTFISDRGTNFRGASRFIREENERSKSALMEIRDSMATTLATKYRIEWKLLPAHSPWMGGFYERAIKEVKRSIALTLENRKVSKIELNIALQDACHRINCRPLTHNPISADDEEVLTPHHLARGRPGWPYLPAYDTSVLPHPLKDKSVFRRARNLADEMMNRFVLGYLPILTRREKWFTNVATPLQVGDIVLVIEPNQTRREWKRARIIKLYKGNDRKTRVADIELSNGTIKIARSIQRLAKLDLVARTDEA
ncbi:hypothetical protein PVAND_000647 [Polypedilum vanderplanki]|uniref:Integrase catalytic domain-containing protein n=1 Tax=Polypedilum vanderplanki TaxID=319348 RepID=A0A9J6BKG7_POLVA|nr:hypothetical protein PVAND_000647 [Polypedilum vanderplanki]